jgi:transposase-like protein
VKNGMTKSNEQEYSSRKCPLTVLWYFRFNLSLRNLAEIMLSRGIDVSHQTISRWIKRFGSEIGQETRAHCLWKTNKRNLKSQAWDHAYYSHTH